METKPSDTMNQDFPHDPLDTDLPLPDHLPDDAHFLSSGSLLDPHHAEDLAPLHPGTPSLFDHTPLPDHLPEDPHHISDPSATHSQDLGSHVIGEPDKSVWHQQQTPFTCAVVSQEMILKEYGVDVNEAHLMGDAMQRGWLSSGGTPFDDIGKLLELHGVHCHEGQGIEQMATELSQGHKLIVGVDSADLWYGDTWAFRELHGLLSGNRADHAIVVEGLRKDDDGSWHVIVNDPGSPDGAGHDYPLDQFTDAWKGGNCHFTATDVPPHGLASHPDFGNGFDEHSGTYPGVMDWLHAHSRMLPFVAGAVVREIYKKSEKSDKERNDILREI